MSRLPAELIVAEDGSKDGTRARILEVGRELPLRVVGAEERLGYTAGRKTARQDQWYRRLLTVGFNGFVRAVFGVEVFDCDSGMRLMSRAVVEATLRRGLTFRGFCSAEIVLRTIASGFRYGEVAITYGRRAGESRGIPLRSMPKVIMRGVRDLLTLRSELR